jgi:magnesium transporter
VEQPGRLANRIQKLVSANGQAQLVALLDETPSEDLADALLHLPLPARVSIFGQLPAGRAGLLLHRTDPETARAVVRTLDEDELSAVLAPMRSEQIATVMRKLPAVDARRVSALVPENQRAGVQQLLAYGAKTAGRFMRPRFAAVREEATVAEAIARLRGDEPDGDTSCVYVVDRHGHLVGVIPVLHLLAAQPVTPLRFIKTADVMAITPDTDEREAARLAFRYHASAIPVIDRNRRLVGSISSHDLLAILQEEATADVQRLAGLRYGETALTPAREIVVSRLLSRLANLGAAFLAASVISIFETSIRAIAALAVFMPIVTAIGRHGSTQTVTLLTRALELRHVSTRQLWPVLKKELEVACLTGLVGGGVIAAIASVWKQQILFGLVLGAALFLNSLAAAIIGVLIPFALQALRIDRAVTSRSVVVTIMDIFGYFSYLGLATAMIKLLL